MIATALVITILQTRSEGLKLLQSHCRVSAPPRHKKSQALSCCRHNKGWQSMMGVHVAEQTPGDETPTDHRLLQPCVGKADLDFRSYRFLQQCQRKTGDTWL